jgi:hypothetical protein
VSEIEPHTDPALAGDDDDAPRPRGRRRGVGLLAWTGVVVALAVAVTLIAGTPGFATFAALALGALILRTGWFFLQSFATPPPPPPDPGQLRKVKLTYRCPTCGAELRMTMAATEDPEPPRHCMEEMELVGERE